MIVIVVPNLFIFYLVFTPITIYSTYLLFSLLAKASLFGANIFVNNISFEIINACIAGSAYYLLFILNLSIPDIKIKKRMEMVLFAFSVFFIINILRIVLLGFLFISNFAFFEITHITFWYFLSTLFVVGIWFWEVKLFRIKQIPFYSDFKFIYGKSSLSKNSKNAKRTKKN